MLRVDFILRFWFMQMPIVGRMRMVGISIAKSGFCSLFLMLKQFQCGNVGFQPAVGKRCRKAASIGKKSGCGKRTEDKYRTALFFMVAVRGRLLFFHKSKKKVVYTKNGINLKSFVVRKFDAIISV